MTQQIIMIGLGLLCVLSALVIIARLPATKAGLSRARVTATGRIKLAGLALLVKIITPIIIRVVRYPREHVKSVERLTVPSSAGNTRLDLYRPASTVASVLPVHFNVHGGGFIVGTLGTDAPWCKYLANRAQCIVINIDYALAPRCTFPSPVFECHDIIRWVVAHASELGIDPRRMSIGGDSAGGNLSLAVALLAIDKREFTLCAVVPGVPVVDVASDPNTKSVSTERKQELTVETLRLVQDVYLPNYADRRDPLASPLFSDRLAELPPTFLVSAEHDILYSDAVAFEAKMRSLGGDVRHLSVKGADHGFLHIGKIEHLVEAWDAMLSAVKEGQRARERTLDHS